MPCHTNRLLAACAAAAALAGQACALDQQQTQGATNPAQSPGNAATSPQPVPRTPQGVQRQTPTAENLDSNAQRSHDRKTTATDKSGKSSGNARAGQARPDSSARSAGTGAAGSGAAAAALAADPASVRNFTQVDQNRDGFMQPEEVEQALGRGGRDTQTQPIDVTPPAPATAASGPPEPVAPAPTTQEGTPGSPPLPTSPATQ